MTPTRRRRLARIQEAILELSLAILYANNFAKADKALNDLVRLARRATR